VHLYACVCRVCVFACLHERACVRACVRVSVCVHAYVVCSGLLVHVCYGCACHLWRYAPSISCMARDLHFVLHFVFSFLPFPLPASLLARLALPLPDPCLGRAHTVCCRDCCAIGSRARRRRPGCHEFTHPWYVGAVVEIGCSTEGGSMQHYYSCIIVAVGATSALVV